LSACSSADESETKQTANTFQTGAPDFDVLVDKLFIQTGLMIDIMSQTYTG